MKLFRKIYFQVILGMVALAVILTGYLLWEMQSRTLEDTAGSESRVIQWREREFREKVQRYNVNLEESTVRKAAMVQVFHNAFGNGGALFENGEELFNASPYDFEWESVKKLEKDGASSGWGVYYSSPQTVGEKKIVVFYMPRLSINSGEYSLVAYKDVTDIYLRTKRLLLRSIGFLILILLALGTALYQGIYRAVRPMIELKKTAASIADGEYGSRVPVRGKDEIREVTVSFNRMAEKVEEHMEALAAVNEQQRQLLGSLAHELKTPMTAIIGYAGTLLTVRLTEERRERALTYIRSEGKRLARLSEKMLELTGLYESGEGGLDRREVKVAELLQRLADLTSFRLGEKELRLEQSCNPKELVKWLDEDLMLSLLMNLVDNACKASRPGGLIRVEADEEKILVEDFGKGIPPEEVNRVTEAFYMVDKSRARSAGSVGLGLALCQQIAKLHGGRLEIESKVGEGTRVTVWLQLAEDLTQNEGVK